MFGEFLAWDINKQETIWAGYPPTGMDWLDRAILIDEKTGMVYTTNRDDSDPAASYLKYDPFKNRFSKLDCHVPPDGAASPTGSQEWSALRLRAQTRDRGPDGLFWGVTYGGQLFTFDPEKEESRTRGATGRASRATPAPWTAAPAGAISTIFPARTAAPEDGSPVCSTTPRPAQKVLAFLFPYFYDKYGYTPGGTFSIKLDDKGERLFILWNGAFAGQSKDIGDNTFGECSVMLVHIPASERANDHP